MKFKLTKRGEEYLTIQELMNPRICGIFFDSLCEWCKGDKEEGKTCEQCGAPSRTCKALGIDEPKEQG